MPASRLIACEDCGKQFKSYYILILHARYHRKESNYIFQRHSASLQQQQQQPAVAAVAESLDAGGAKDSAMDDSLEPLASPGAEEPPTIFGQLSCSPPNLPNPLVGEGEEDHEAAEDEEEVTATATTTAEEAVEEEEMEGEDGEGVSPRLVYMSEQDLRRRQQRQQFAGSNEEDDDVEEEEEEQEEQEELECEICDARFQQVLELLKHIRAHRYELTESNYQQYRRKIVTTHRPAGVRVDLRRFPEDAGAYGGASAASASAQKSSAGGGGGGGGAGTEYECDYCGKRFPTASNLKRHIPVHTGERPHQCPFCGCRFGDRSYMLKHTRFVHNVELARVQKSKSRSRNAKGSFKCQICDKYFENGDILAVHLEKYHSRPGKVSRPADSGVEDEYPEEEDDDEQEREEEEEEEEEEELLIDTGVQEAQQAEALYPCELCTFVFNDLQQLQEHLAQHSAAQQQQQQQEQQQQQQQLAEPKPKLTVTISDA